MKSLNDYADLPRSLPISFSLSVALPFAILLLGSKVTYCPVPVNIWLDPRSIYSAERSIDGVSLLLRNPFSCRVALPGLAVSSELKHMPTLGRWELSVEEAVVESLPRPMRFLSLSKATPGTIIAVDLILWNFYAVRLRFNIESSGFKDSGPS